jgi:hypothetical protein
LRNFNNYVDKEGKPILEEFGYIVNFEWETFEYFSIHRKQNWKYTLFQQLADPSNLSINQILPSPDQDFEVKAADVWPGYISTTKFGNDHESDVEKVEEYEL